MKTSAPLRNTMARKPSHFGSKRNPSVVGSDSATFDSMGSTGGVMAKSVTIAPSANVTGAAPVKATMSTLLQDLRYTLRTLRRDAGFALFAIVIAGLGIGASSTVFSVVNTLLLHPLPFSEPGRLVWIANHDTSGLSGQTTQVAQLLDLRERTQSLSAVAGYFAFYGVGDSLLTGRGEPERLSGVPVSGNFFDVL